MELLCRNNIGTFQRVEHGQNCIGIAIVTVYFNKGYLYNGYLDVPFNFEIGENEYTFNDAYDEIMAALAEEDETY